MTETPLEDLLLGVAEIDADHAESIARWKIARDAVPSEFLGRLTDFVDHLAEHFAREEALMTAIGYREFAHHAAEHARVIAEGRRFCAQVAAGRTMMARAYATDMVPDWLRRHIVMFDSDVARVARLAGRA